ncbi:MAG: serine protease [Myxococcaceae bacterium]
MRPLAALAIAVLASSAGASSAPSRPTHASLRKAYEQNVHSLVTVKHGKRSGPGVIVGADGQVLTSVQHVGLEQATVVVDGVEHEAQVIAANARLKIAVIQLPGTTTMDGGARWSVPAVSEAPPTRGHWVVGVVPASGAKKEPSPVAGRVMKEASTSSAFLLTDLALPPGSPLFDTRGRLVALVVERAGRIGSRALPIAAVRAELSKEQPVP